MRYALAYTTSHFRTTWSTAALSPRSTWTRRGRRRHWTNGCRARRRPRSPAPYRRSPHWTRLWACLGTAGSARRVPRIAVSGRGRPRSGRLTPGRPGCVGGAGWDGRPCESWGGACMGPPCGRRAGNRCASIGGSCVGTRRTWSVVGSGRRPVGGGDADARVAPGPCEWGPRAARTLRVPPTGRRACGGTDSWVQGPMSNRPGGAVGLCLDWP